MNWRTIARKLTAGEIYYALGRFYWTRRTYGAIRGLRCPARSPQSQSSGIFASESAEAAVQGLRAEGVAPGFDLPEEVVAEVREYALRSPCRRSGDRRQFRYSDVTGGYLSDGNPVVLGFVEEPRSCPSIDRLCADPVLLAAASPYLGYWPQNVEPRLYWSFVCNVSHKDRLALWQTVDYHFDVDGYNFVYANFHLTDTDRVSGAHAYIRASHRHKPWWMLLYSANQSDETVARYFGNDSEVVVEGAAGHGFLQDASCYHKAIAPKSRERLMLQIRVR
jgi:hypothetical protein